MGSEEGGDACIAVSKGHQATAMERDFDAGGKKGGGGVIT